MNILTKKRVKILIFSLLFVGVILIAFSIYSKCNLELEEKKFYSNLGNSAEFLREYIEKNDENSLKLSVEKMRDAFLVVHYNESLEDSFSKKFQDIDEIERLLSIMSTKRLNHDDYIEVAGLLEVISKRNYDQEHYDAWLNIGNLVPKLLNSMGEMEWLEKPLLS